MRVRLLRLPQLLGKQGREHSNVLFVEGEDIRLFVPVRAGGIPFRLAVRCGRSACAQPFQSIPVVGIVQKIPFLLPVGPVPEQNTPFHRQAQPAADLLSGVLAVSTETLEQRHIVEEFVHRNHPQAALFPVEQPEGSQDNFQLRNVGDFFQQRAQHGVRHRCIRLVIGETSERHNQKASTLCKDSNRTRLSRKYRDTLPVGPLRCLATMISARFLGYWRPGKCCSHSSSV